jgi:hypothetical protein
MFEAVSASMFAVFTVKSLPLKFDALFTSSSIASAFPEIVTFEPLFISTSTDFEFISPLKAEPEFTSIPICFAVRFPEICEP